MATQIVFNGFKINVFVSHAEITLTDPAQSQALAARLVKEGIVYEHRGGQGYFWFRFPKAAVPVVQNALLNP